MKESIIRRLKNIEKRSVQPAMLVIAKTDLGEEIVISLCEALEREDLILKRFVYGRNYKDLDRWLAYIEESARKYIEEIEENER